MFRLFCAFIVSGILVLASCPFVSASTDSIDSVKLGCFVKGSLKSDFGGEWEILDDKPNNGNSSSSFAFIEGRGPGAKAVKVDYELKGNYKHRYITFEIRFPKILDLSKYNSISFWMKGSGHKVKFQLATEYINDYDFHEYNIPATSSEWKEYKIPLSAFFQEGWGVRKELDVQNVIKVAFQTVSMAEGEKGWFAVEDLTLSTEDAFDPIQEMELPNQLALENFDKEGFELIQLGAMWEAVDDSVNGGNSKARLSLGEYGNKKTLRLDYELGAAYKYRYAMAHLTFLNPVDLSKYKWISISIRGSADKLKFHFGTFNVEDYDYHGYALRFTTRDWKEYRLPINSLKQEGWGKKAVLDFEKIKTIQFQTASMMPGEKGWIEIGKIVLESGDKKKERVVIGEK